MVTSLRTREKTVNLDQLSPVPITFIFKLTEELAPRSIADTSSKLMVLDHISNCQVFKSYQAIFSNQARSQLMQKIGTSIFNLGVYFGYFKSRFISVTRAFGFPTQFLLRCLKFLIQPIEMLGVGYFLTVAGTNQTGYASIDTNLFLRWWQCLNGIVVYQQRDKPSARRFEFDGNSRWTTAVRQKPRPNNWQWFFAFSKPKFSISIFKSRLGKLCRTTIALGFKPGILGSFAPEVSKRFLQMSQTLLQRHAANFVKEVKIFGFLPISKKTRCFFVLNSLLPFIPSFSSSIQSFVVDQSHAPHCPSQEIFLLGSGKKSVFVSSFNHSSHSTIFNVKNLIGGAHSSHR